jgi:hypothetical protein
MVVVEWMRVLVEDEVEAGSVPIKQRGELAPASSD